MKINILLCDVFEDIMPFDDINYLQMIQKLFLAEDPTIKFEVFEAFARDLPQKIELDSVYLIPGGRATSYEDVPWINELANFITELHEEKVKMVGICFGHQLIAEVLGGRVEKAYNGWGLGIRESKITNKEYAHFFSNESLTLSNIHQDQVVILPPHAEILASSDFCAIEAFTIGKQVICFQGHPEYNNEYMRHLIKHQSFQISEILRTKALRSLNQITNEKELVKFTLSLLKS